MPSEKVLEAKKAQVAELVEVLNGATTGVLVDYRGLSVEEDTKLRNDLRAAGVKYFVVNELEVKSDCPFFNCTSILPKCKSPVLFAVADHRSGSADFHIFQPVCCNGQCRLLGILPE